MIRNDFVSNSSSSSFMVIGKDFTQNELKDILFRKYKDVVKILPREPDIFDLIDKIPHQDLDFCYGIENYYDDVCVGIHYNLMKMDETRKEFEDRVKKQLKDVLDYHGGITCLVDGGYTS